MISLQGMAEKGLRSQLKFKLVTAPRMVERSKASIFVLDQEGEEEVPSSRQRRGNFFFASCLRLDCGTGARIACQEEANGEGRT